MGILGTSLSEIPDYDPGLLLQQNKCVTLSRVQYVSVHLSSNSYLVSCTIEEESIRGRKFKHFHTLKY